MTAHSELMARLEGASEGSRELDISLALETTHVYGFDSEREIDAYPHPTTSIDDALTLAERVLPGWDFIVGRTNGGLTIHAQVGPGEMQFGNTPALALCIAVLRAKEPQPDGEKT